MKVKYRVKLDPTSEPNSNRRSINGYLDGGFGRIGSYTRGEAIKKAGMFDGKIERIVETFIITDARIAQITENSLLHGVLKELKGREQFLDCDENLGERMYQGDVFEAILSDIAELKKIDIAEPPKKVMEQLEELADAMGEYQYVQITMV